MDESAIIWELKQQICSKAEVATALVRDVVRRLKRYEWLDKDVFGIHMALEEALMNAIKHGNANDCTKKIFAVIRIRENSFYSKIRDEGQGFDPDSVPDPCDETNLLKDCGRGVALIRNLVDEVNYNSAGNTVEFCKLKSKNSTS
jgi:serine/threonine-protein kinase RsbW